MTSSEGGGLRAYAALLRRPYVARFLLGGVIIQFPYAMVNMALLIGARDVYGSYSSAGVATAVMSIAGAVIGPTIGRLIDRHGQSRIASLVGAFWIASILGLGLVLVLGLPYWALLLVVVMLGASVPGGSLIRARWRVALRSEPGSNGLVVLPREVVNALCGGLAFDAGVGSVVIVGVEPVRVGGFAFGFAGVGARVGPFGEQGPVEAFDLPVRLGAVGPGVPVFHRVCERPVEHVRPVAGPVVGEHFAHTDPRFGEESSRPLPKARGRRLGLIVEDLGVDQTRVIVDRVVQVPVAARP